MSQLCRSFLCFSSRRALESFDEGDRREGEEKGEWREGADWRLARDSAGVGSCPLAVEAVERHPKRIRRDEGTGQRAFRAMRMTVTAHLIAVTSRGVLRPLLRH